MSAIIRGGCFTGWSLEVWRNDGYARNGEKKGTSRGGEKRRDSLDQKARHTFRTNPKREAGSILETHTQAGVDAIYGEEGEKHRERERSDTFRSRRCNGHSPVNE